MPYNKPLEHRLEVQELRLETRDFEGVVKLQLLSHRLATYALEPRKDFDPRSAVTPKGYTLPTRVL